MKCPSCDQTILPDDATCWQCGHRFKDEPNAPNVKEQWQEASEADNPLPVYIGLTAIIIILALVLTVSLGRQPLVQASTQVPAEGWQIVVNEPRSFIVHIPEAWTFYDAFDSTTSDVFNEQVITSQLFSHATRPLGEFVDDARPIFVAVTEPLTDKPNPDQFFLIVRSDTLNQWTPEQAISASSESNVEIVSSENVENFDKSHAFFWPRIPYAGGELNCRQQFVDGNREEPEHNYAMLVIACGPDANTSVEILDTFQRLDRE